VVTHHHDLLDEHSFRMVHLIRIADRMADTLGFAVVAPLNAVQFADVVEELPDGTRDRFHSDAEELSAEIDVRIQSWS